MDKVDSIGGYTVSPVTPSPAHTVGPRIHAIPTMYGGRQFRSRLEARWAAFFDLMQWNWDYEPIDLDGWIPDFVVGDLTTGVFVEVKPIDFGAVFDSTPIDRAAGELAALANTDELNHARSQVPLTSRGFLVLGARPFGGSYLGVAWEPRRNLWHVPNLCENDLGMQVDQHERSAGLWGLMGGVRVEDYNVEAAPFWHKAGNRVQYKSPVRA